MTTVTIGTGPSAKTYDTYADVAVATDYLTASLASYATAFLAATDDNKARSLVMATRWIDAQNWLGEKSDPDQPLQWPRSGIAGVDPLVVPQQIVDASITLAAMLIENPALQTELSSGGAAETKRLKAGSAEIEYFRSASAFKWKNNIFPPDIWNLLRGWLVGSAGGYGGAESFDTCRPSAFEHDFGFNDGFS